MIHVLQSCKADPPPWMTRCLDSVRAWAAEAGHAYRFLEDEAFFAMAPAWAWEKAGGRPQMVADIARLAWMRAVVAGGDTAVWLDADTFVFGPLAIPDDSFACGREVWVQPGKGGRRLAVHRGPHNAALVARPGNRVLDFLHLSAESILRRVAPGKGPPQLIGPKLLAALDPLADFPRWDACGALSPLVLRDLADGGGPALDLFRHESPPLAAANLCASLAEDEGVMRAAMDALLSRSAACPGCA